MIRSIHIKGLRGIQAGKLADLPPLTILVGPNGSGKSTILDALLIGASSAPAEAIAQAVERRLDVRRGARWLLSRPSEEETRGVEVSTEAGNRVSYLTWSGEGGADSIAYGVVSGEGGIDATVRFSPDNKCQQASAEIVSPKGVKKQNYRGPGLPGPRAFDGASWPGGVQDVRLVDAYVFNQPIPLHQLYSRSVEQG